MDHPVDLKRPFFAYGIFRPGELGFFQLREFVGKIEQPSQVTGCLRLRDGLPILDRAGSGMVTGTLLHFATAQAAEGAYGRITALEPEKQYRWEAFLIHSLLKRLSNTIIKYDPTSHIVERASYVITNDY